MDGPNRLLTDRIRLRLLKDLLLGEIVPETFVIDVGQLRSIRYSISEAALFSRVMLFLRRSGLVDLNFSHT